jgi:hypothetical protein
VVGVELTPVDLCHSLCSEELAQTQLSLSRGVLQPAAWPPHTYYWLCATASCMSDEAEDCTARIAGKPPRVDHLVSSLPPSDFVSAFLEF